MESTPNQYHNTTKESGTQLALYEDLTVQQDQKVLAIIQNLHAEGKKISASKIFNEIVSNVPITSIRRSLNTLEYKLGKVVKTGNKIKGLYGRKENTYTLIID